MENHVHGGLPTITPPKPKKRSAISVLYAALFPQRRTWKPKKAEKAVPVVPSKSRSKWRFLLSSLRPFHHHQLNPPFHHNQLNPPFHHNQLNPPFQLNPPSSPESTTLAVAESFHDVTSGPPSPEHSSSDGMSGYASAEDLLMLDDTIADEEEVEGGDEEIDLKAEEFITRFYEQIRLERLVREDDAMDQGV